MKSYTILEALEAIQENTPLLISHISSISYFGDSGYKFTVVCAENTYGINLDNFTYYRL